MRTIALALLVASLYLNTLPCARAAEPQSVEQSPRAQVSIEARFVSAPVEILNGLGLENAILVPPAAEPEPLFSLDPDRNDGASAIQLISASSVVEESHPPIHVQMFNAQQAKEFVNQAQGDRRSNIQQAPKVTVWDRETAEVASPTMRPFVVDVQKGRPLVREYQTGTTIMARPCVKDSGSVQLDLRVRLDHIEAVEVYNNGEQQVQCPTINALKVELSANLKPGETLVIWVPTPEVAAPPAGLSKLLRKKTSDEAPKSTLVLLITPRIVVEAVAAATK